MVGQLEPLFCQLTKWERFINSICHIKSHAAAHRLTVRPGWVLHKAGGGTYLVLQVSLGPITRCLGQGRRDTIVSFGPRSSW